MYEELGTSAADSAVPASASTLGSSSAAASASASAVSDYYQSYQSYPYGQQYMTGFSYGTSASAAAAAASYDRTMYNPYNSPGAFVPHSAINLSVKSAGDLPVASSASNPHSSLDLTLNEANPASYLGAQVFGSSSTGASNTG